MTPQAAEALAVRIAQTWPQSRTAAVDIWADDLADLDEGAAGTALVRLRRELDRAPSIAQFRNTVLSLTTTDASNRPAPCGACKDTGWIEADTFELDNGTGPDDSITYSSAKPCACTHGNRAARSPAWTHRTRHQ